MIYNVVKNSKGTVTLVIGGCTFYSAKYLLERYNDKRYFGNAILPLKFEELRNVVKEIVAKLNIDSKLAKKVAYSDLFDDNREYSIFKVKKDKDDKPTENFEMSISAPAAAPRNIFFESLAKDSKAITDESVIKSFEWALEVEFSCRYDEDFDEVKVYAFLHRCIKGKAREVSYLPNDEAWAGFNFGTEESTSTTEEKKNTTEDKDIFASLIKGSVTDDDIIF